MSGKEQAFGRALTDFGDLLNPDDFSKAERQLLECCKTGQVAKIGEHCPDEETDDNRIRASLVRFLALGGDEQAPVHECGVQLQGAWLTDVLDLQAVEVKHRLPIWACRIEHIDAKHCRLMLMNLSGCRLEQGLSACGLHCDNDVFLRDGFHSHGEVDLTGAKIGGDLDCRKGLFDNPGGVALCLDRAAVDGAFFFREVEMVEGKIDLTAMRVASLGDDLASWKRASGNIYLDGFTYDRIGGSSPVDAATRVVWLEQQASKHLSTQFRPQPWEQVIAALRAAGHPDEARNVAVAKQTRLRNAGKIVRGGGWLHWLYGKLAGYGYRPARLLVSIPLVWLICAACYWAAVNPGWFRGATPVLAPAQSGPSTACLIARAAARSGNPCPSPPPDYRTFYPLVYSADVLLPIVDLGYQKDWQPVVTDAQGTPLRWGLALRFVYWFEIAFGWIAGLLLAAIAGSLLKRD